MWTATQLTDVRHDMDSACSLSDIADLQARVAALADHLPFTLPPPTPLTTLLHDDKVTPTSQLQRIANNYTVIDLTADAADGSVTGELRDELQQRLQQSNAPDVTADVDQSKQYSAIERAKAARLRRMQTQAEPVLPSDVVRTDQHRRSAAATRLDAPQNEERTDDATAGAESIALYLRNLLHSSFTAWYARAARRQRWRERVIQLRDQHGDIEWPTRGIGAKFRRYEIQSLDGRDEMVRQWRERRMMNIIFATWYVHMGQVLEPAVE